MVDLWRILIQFVLWLTLGMSASMILISSPRVDGAFFRLKLWVLMGLNTLGSLVVFSQRESLSEQGIPAAWLLGLTIAAAVVSYVAAVVWLYEARGLGKFLLILLAAIAASGAWLLAAASWGDAPAEVSAATVLAAANVLTGSAMLGTIMTAMLLGHWYLNSPGMPLEPIQRLVLLIGVAVGARTIVAVAGLAMLVSTDFHPSRTFWIFLSLRWLAGLIGTGVMAVMTWYTLKVPNTQSATGILYAALILCFIGELVAQLLSANLAYPI